MGIGCKLRLHLRKASRLLRKEYSDHGCGLEADGCGISRLYYQGFNIAQKYVDEAAAKHKKKNKPLAVITDMDDTIVLHDRYWAHLIANGEEFFNDPVWDKYIPTNSLIPAPGALDFLNHCKEKGVEVFYVTSRDQGEGTYEMALENLQKLGFPYGQGTSDRAGRYFKQGAPPK